MLEYKTVITIVTLAFAIGAALGEYQACPKDKYKWEYGCER